MNPLRVGGATRRLAKDQPEYLELSVRDVEVDGHPAMMSSWEPTPAEILRLMGGAPVRLTILGTVHPPVKLTVGDPPDDVPPGLAAGLPSVGG